MKKIAIIGAGPAGLASAYYLSPDSNLDITIFDKGPDIEERINLNKKKSTNLLFGLGGAGCFSDGKVNLHPTVGGNLTRLGLTRTEAKALVNKMYEELFYNFSEIKPIGLNYNKKSINNLSKKAQDNEIRFKHVIQKHIGTENLPYLLKNIKAYLISSGIKFKFNTEVKEIKVKDKSCKGLYFDNKFENFDEIVFCTGRTGQSFIRQISKENNIPLNEKEIDLGIRIEIPYKSFSHLTDINYDPKFVMNINGVKTRTFCTNPKGFVVLERKHNYFSVNGHAYHNIKSSNTNFAILHEIQLSGKTGFDIVDSILNKIKSKHGLKIILQKLNESSQLKTKPTLNKFVESDISEFFGKNNFDLTINALKRLSSIAPELNKCNINMYFPEIKMNSLRLKLNDNLESSIKNLYFAGDCSGLTGDIIHSASMGYLIANRILIK